MTQENFFQKYKVFLTGLAGAIALALQQFIATPEGEIDWKVIGLAALLAIAGYVANEWRGQTGTIAGFIGVAAGTFVTVQSTGHFSWPYFILSCVIGYLASVAPPPKSIGYEKSSLIESAKAEGEVVKPSTAPPNPPI